MLLLALDDPHAESLHVKSFQVRDGIEKDVTVQKVLSFFGAVQAPAASSGGGGSSEGGQQQVGVRQGSDWDHQRGCQKRNTLSPSNKSR